MIAATMLLATAAFVLAVRVPKDPRLSNERRGAWRRLGLSFAVYLAFETLVLVLDAGAGAKWSAFAKPTSDVGGSIFHLFLAWAILSFPRPSFLGPSRLRSHLDLAVTVLGAGLLLWFLTVQPVLRLEHASASEVIQSVAGSLGGLALLVALAAFSLQRPGQHLPAFLLLAAGAATRLGTAVGTANEPLLLGQDAANALGGLPVVGWGLFLAAAILERQSYANTPEPDDSDAPILRLSLLPYVVSGSAFVFVLYEFGFRLERNPGQLALSVTTLGGIMLVRQFFVQRENLHLETERTTAREKRGLNTLLTYSSDVTLILSDDGTVRYVSPSAQSIFGWSPSDLQGTCYVGLVHPEDRDDIRQFLRQTASDRDTVPYARDWRLQNATGQWRHVEGLLTNRQTDEGVGGLLLNVRDVTERKTLERQLSYQALHDPLTGLANRSLLTDRAHHALDQAVRRGDSVGLLFLDLDEFKRVNDTLGHNEGDKLLVEVAMRLQGECRRSDTVARLGGDEFAVLLEEAGDRATAEQVAQRILEDLCRPYPMLGGHIPISASIGISVSDGGLHSAEELLRRADLAMYGAKSEGKNAYKVFNDDMAYSVRKRLRLEAELRSALPRKQFVLHYQPIVSLQESRIVGVEALLRWEHPTLGLLLPGHFLQLAEDTNLIIPIGRDTLLRACREVAGWAETTEEAPLLFVNLSAKELLAPQLVPSVRRALDESLLPPDHLILEITENTLIEDKELVGARLSELSETGVQLAIDDFGSGYSSLCYLREFPADLLKLAKPFVDDLCSSRESRNVVSAVLELARAVGLEVIAEGIEHEEQRKELLAMSCGFGQGYCFTPPRPAAEVRLLWERQHNTVAPCVPEERVSQDVGRDHPLTEYKSPLWEKDESSPLDSAPPSPVGAAGSPYEGPQA